MSGLAWLFTPTGEAVFTTAFNVVFVASIWALIWWGFRRYSNHEKKMLDGYKKLVADLPPLPELPPPSILCPHCNARFDLFAGVDAHDKALAHAKKMADGETIVGETTDAAAANPAAKPAAKSAAKNIH